MCSCLFPNWAEFALDSARERGVRETGCGTVGQTYSVDMEDMEEDMEDME